jgi:hypothetical protein
MIVRARRALRFGAPVAALSLVLAAACSDSSSPSSPEENETPQLTVDASTNWAFVRLGATAQQVTVASPGASSDWDIAFNATSVMLNGGSVGPAGVTGYCLCQNGEVTAAQVQAFTPAGELPDFDAVNASMAPATASSWSADSVAEAVTGWWSYDIDTHVVSAAPGKVWKVRLAARAGSSDTAYAKFHVISIENAARENAGKVTFEYAVQTRKGAAMGAVKTATVDLSAGPVSFDLLTGAAAAGAWDVRFTGYSLRLNGGSSGAGNAGASPVDESFPSIADASDLVSQQYLRDATGGVFSQKPWYLYNVTGSDHQIWPTFQVYLVKRGTELYKVQVTGYYDASANPRHITFRYEKLAG